MATQQKPVVLKHDATTIIGSIGNRKAAYESSTTASSTTHKQHSSSTTSSVASAGGAIQSNGTHVSTPAKGGVLISTSKIDRSEERVVFGGLNNRLAKYIEVVKQNHLTKEEVQNLMNSAQTTTTIDQASSTKIYKEIEASFKEDINKLHARITQKDDEINRLNKLLTESTVKIAYLEKKVLSSESRIDTITKTQIVEHGEEISRIIAKYTREYDELKNQLDQMRTTFKRLIEEKDIKLEEMCNINWGVVKPIDHNPWLAELEKAKKETMRYRSDYTKVHAEITARDAEIVDLKQRIAELEKMRLFPGCAGMDQAFRQSIETTVQEHLRKYKYLLEENIQLIAELNIFDQLLRSEEARFHIYQIHDHMGQSFTIRKHTHSDIVIDEVDTQGNYIRLINTGNHSVPMNGWTLRSKAGGQTGTYVFKHALDAGKSVTIWSHNNHGKGTHNPPESYVVKDVHWPSGTQIHVDLVDQHNQDQAWLTAKHDVGEHTHSHHHHHSGAHLQHDHQYGLKI